MVSIVHTIAWDTASMVSQIGFVLITVGVFIAWSVRRDAQRRRHGNTNARTTHKAVIATYALVIGTLFALLGIWLRVAIN